MNSHCRCSHHCLRPPVRYCHCHSQEISCSCSTPIEEFFTWICIGSLIVFFYNTIKLCIITGVLLWMVYWFNQQTNFLQSLKKFTEKNIVIEPSVETSSPSFTPNFDIDPPTSIDNDDMKVDRNCDETKILKRKKESRQSSRFKKIFSTIFCSCFPSRQ